MKGKLIKIYGPRDPTKEAQRMEAVKAWPPVVAMPSLVPEEDLGYRCAVDDETRYAVIADELAWSHPDEFSKFLSYCKSYGITGALNVCHLSEDVGILHLWGIKIHREHPEIEA